MLLAGKIVRARARGLRLVSGLLLAVQVLSLGHLLSVQHVTCPEHGEIIHVERLAGIPASRLTASVEGLLRCSLEAAEPSEGGDHDHCQACVEANRRTLLAGPDHAFAHHPLAISLAHATQTAFFAPIDLILLSPKGSPPVV